MRRLFLTLVKKFGRYLVLIIFALAAAIFTGWLTLLESSGIWFLLFAIVAIPIASGAIALLIGALFSGTRPDIGIGVTRQDAPKLWAIIDGVFGEPYARNVQLYLSPEVEAWIMTSRRYFGFFGEVIHLNLGVPIFKLCTAADVGGVVTHEYAHLRHRDTNGSRNIVEFEGAFATLYEFAPPGETILGTLVDAVFGRLQVLLQHVDSELSREAELAADRAAAKSGHSHDLASALYRLTASSKFLEKSVHDPLERELLGSMSAPKSAFERIMDLPDPICSSREFFDCWNESLQDVADPTDSHPMPVQRLEALGMAADWQVDPTDGPALAELVPAALLERASREFRESWVSHLEGYYER